MIRRRFRHRRRHRSPREGARRHFPAWQRPLGLFLLGAWPWSRMVSGGLLSRLSGRARFAEAAAMWGDVWQARGEWLKGYPAAVS